MDVLTNYLQVECGNGCKRQIGPATGNRRAAQPGGGRGRPGHRLFRLDEYCEWYGVIVPRSHPDSPDFSGTYEGLAL